MAHPQSDIPVRAPAETSADDTILPFEIGALELRGRMRHWYEAGQLDLYATTKDLGTAKQVHDCIGRALASLIIDTARLPAREGNTAQ